MSDNEPFYVDDPWEDEDTAWTRPDDFNDPERMGTAFAVCGRTAMRFRTRAERNKWRKVDKRMKKLQIPMEWWEHCVGWARTKNKQRTIIKLTALASYMLNTAAMQDWLVDNPTVGKEMIETLGFHEGDIND